ncbi:MAG: hypothetical protein LBR60_08140 [Fibrobacter sp.]|jgi:hypothetical protein|nr:hypothetical protein [Fibrobacter sp.]
MKKLTLLFILLVVGFSLVGCDDMLGKILPDVITDSVNNDRTGWTIQGSGSGSSRTQYFTLTEAELNKVSASVQYVGGSSELIIMQGELSRTTKLHGSGITQSKMKIDMTGFLPDIQLSMRVDVSNISSGQTTISWE